MDAVVRACAYVRVCVPACRCVHLLRRFTRQMLITDDSDREREKERQGQWQLPRIVRHVRVDYRSKASYEGSKNHIECGPKPFPRTNRFRQVPLGCTNRTMYFFKIQNLRENLLSLWFRGFFFGRENQPCFMIYLYRCSTSILIWYTCLVWHLIKPNCYSDNWTT